MMMAAENAPHLFLFIAGWLFVDTRYRHALCISLFLSGFSSVWWFGVETACFSHHHP